MKLLLSSILLFSLISANEFPLVQPISVERATVIKKSVEVQHEMGITEDISKSHETQVKGKRKRKKEARNPSQESVRTKIFDIQFDRDKEGFSEEVTQKIVEFSKYLQKNRSYQVVLYGYTDTKGEKHDDMILSQKRTNSVKKLLILHGISSTRLTAVGMGSKGRGANCHIEALIIK